MWVMPYCTCSQSRAETKAVPLSVTISWIPPQQQRTSSKMNALSVCPVSCLSIHHSGQAVSEQCPCTMYWKPAARGMNIVLINIFRKSGAGESTVTGMCTFVDCCSWQLWQVRMNLWTSALRLGHQKQSSRVQWVANTPLCPSLSCASRNSTCR